MSRRLTSIQQRPRISTHVTADNPYQSTTTEPSHQENFYIHRPKHFTRDSCQTKCSHHYQNDCTKVSGVSDDNFTDTNTYYEYFPDNVYHPSPRKDSRNVEYTFSDDSGSTSLPRYDYEEVSLKRHSRNTASDRGFKAMQQVSVKNGKVLNNVLVHKDVRKIYPNQENQCDRLYHEIVGPRSSSESATTFPRRDPPRSRLSDRPQSSQSSGVPSAIVDGCGGRCQTFENVCYYFLQVAFTMGILIGTSLCIAGAVLRKSAARNLQVLVYIGAMLSFVSALLLGVQCRARNLARKRRKALRNAKRAPIPLDTFHSRALSVPVQQQPLMVVDARCPQIQGAAAYPQRSILIKANPMADEQGIPWWRRKDLAQV